MPLARLLLRPIDMNTSRILSLLVVLSFMFAGCVSDDPRTGVTPCGVNECQAGFHCQNETTSACESGCIDDENCAEGDTCENKICVAIQDDDDMVARRTSDLDGTNTSNECKVDAHTRKLRITRGVCPQDFRRLDESLASLTPRDGGLRVRIRAYDVNLDCQFNDKCECTQMSEVTTTLTSGFDGRFQQSIGIAGTLISKDGDVCEFELI